MYSGILGGSGKKHRVFWDLGQDRGGEEGGSDNLAAEGG